LTKIKYALQFYSNAVSKLHVVTPCYRLKLVHLREARIVSAVNEADTVSMQSSE